MSTFTIANLVTSLGFKVDDAELKRYEGQLNNLVKAGTALAAVGTAAVASLFGIARATANAGDEARKTAQRVGASTEEWQQFRHAAELAGVGAGEAQSSIQKLSRSMADAERGTGRAGQVFSDLGVNIHDAITGELRPSIDVLEDVATALGGVQSEAQKTDIMMTLLGRSGGNMAPFLNQGGEAIRAMREEAEALGLVIRDDVAREGEDLNDEMTRLRGVITGVRNVIGAQLIPTITEYVTAARTWIQANREIIAARVKDTLVALAQTVRFVVGLLSWMGRTVWTIVEAFGGLERVIAIARFVLIGFVGVQILSGLRAMVGIVMMLVHAWRTVGIAALLAQAKMLAIPIAIGAAIATLVLLVQDFITFLRGGESLIGDFVARFAESEGVLGAVARWLLNVRSILNNLPANVQMFLDFFRDAWGRAVGMMSAEWEAFKAFVVGFFVWIGELVSMSAQGYAMAWQAALGLVMSGLLGLRDGFRAVFDFIAGITDRVLGGIVGRLTAITDRVGGLARRFGIGGGDDSPSVPQDAVRAAQSAMNDQSGAMGAARDRAASQSTTNALSVGEVSVQIQGSTGMGQAEVRSAVADGLDQGLQRQLDAMRRNTAGAPA